jgi:anti-sigma factor RsiW
MMTCQDTAAQIADYLTGTLAASDLEALRAHAATCATCRDELLAAEDTWQQLARIPAMPPDLDAMRNRFDAMLADSRAPVLVMRGSRRVTLSALAAAALLVLGVAIGRQTAGSPGSSVDTQLAALRNEIGEMRQTMSLSLLQQASATARLQGVIATQQIADPNRDIIAALLDALTYDPNANVRLAAVDALKRFADRDLVKRGAVRALARQTSPLVQIALIDFVVESTGAESADALRQLSRDATATDAVRARASQALRHVGAKS